MVGMAKRHQTRKIMELRTTLSMIFFQFSFIHDRHTHSILDSELVSVTVTFPLVALDFNRSSESVDSV